MNDSHYLVTGGAGFIGSHLVDALISSNHRVVVLDDFSTGREENLKSASNSGRLEIIRGDIRDQELVQAAAKNAKGIFHLAALVSVQRSIEAPFLSFDINVRGAINVLEAARIHAVPRVVLASSAAVYKESATPVNETSSETKPLSPYALDKLVIERYGSLYSDLYGIGTVALRYFNVYGSRQDPSSPYSGVISIFSGQIQDGSRIRIYGDGEQTRDFIHVSDIARITRAAMESAGSSAQVFNVGTGMATSINQLVGNLSSVLNRPVDCEFLPKRDGDIRHSVADISLIREQFGYRPIADLTTGLREVVSPTV